MTIGKNKKKKRKLIYEAEATCSNADLVEHKTEGKKKICLELPELYCFPSEKGEIQAISITTEVILRCWGYFCIEGFSALHTAIA